MNNPFDYIPDAACNAAFQKLVDKVEILKLSKNPDDVNFCRELEAGKMLGILIASDRDGNIHTLYAFSGQLGDGGFYHNGFVGPVFDYLQPDGYFKTHEAEISRQNREIALYENETYAKIKQEFEEIKATLDAEITDYKEICRLSKLRRDAIRDAGSLDDSEISAMIRQSQFEKAELRRIKKRVAENLEPYSANLKKAEAHLKRLKTKRHADSEALQNWLFSNFQLLNARGEWKSLKDIFAETTLKVPPSGAGECCAPKLLQAAYIQNLNPISIAEYWYGKPKDEELRIHGQFYPACRGKCLPVLGWMLQGLEITPPLDSERISANFHEPEIIYENRWFCVINKPSGMLSVPGKGVAVSVQQWLEEKYGKEKEVKVAHRLDQDTSGLLIATFGEVAYKIMQSLFAMRNVRKTYIAELNGDYKSKNISTKGRINLPLSPDWLDRPRQRVDFENGKEGVTDFEFIDFKDGHSRVNFHPHTGRTHQLRVHAASEQGLGMPIVGDRLYGRNPRNDNSQRLLLHAHKVEFTFPLDGKNYCFESPVPF